MNKAGTQRIETQRLILRRFRAEDAEDMFNNWASDPEVTRYLTWPVHSSAEVTRTLLTEWVSHYADGGYFNWAMEYKETGKVIGNISVVKLNENTEAADMGYCMSRAYWGQGLMPEALKAVMAYLFDVVGLNRIAACHDVNNPKSGRVMDKAGMKQEGILRAAGKNNLGICDEVWHAAIRKDRDSFSELAIELQDTEWPFEFTDHDRMIARAICFDDDGYFYFVRAERDDHFGKATLIETSGGGAEAGEDLQSAIKRELKEELGAEVEIVCKIGVVSDYYNLIHRHNINNYFLCRIKSFGDKSLTKDEIEDFHLSTLKMTYDEAVDEYEKRRETKLGRLIANRELPVLRKAMEMIAVYGVNNKNKTRVAHRGDRKTEPMPRQHDTFVLNRSFSEKEMDVLRCGNIPQAMEDKWFWYMEGSTLWAHRSWTGYCIYRIDFQEDNDHIVTVNRDPDQYRCINIEEDIKSLNKLLDWWTKTPYDHYNEWLSETYDTLKRSGKV